MRRQPRNELRSPVVVRIEFSPSVLVEPFDKLRTGFACVASEVETRAR